MKRVIVFFNLAPAVVMSLMDGVTSIRKAYPSGQEIQLQIMSAGFPSLTGDSMVVHVASDRTLSSDEILEAANKLL
ncbi:hypothetical protein [Pantoea sp. C8B4]|uniref:hypothetical protein n=1 Tax=Pantoea sp. C8B4 TaxID=3243083 RepID=UPI00073E7738|nr:hypothetical protein [Type-D symbiont of Plautia stali]